MQCNWLVWEYRSTPLLWVIRLGSSTLYICRLLGGEVKEEKGKQTYSPPKYKLEELFDAVRKCNMAVIKEFIEEIYSKRNEKVHHCVEMWKVSQKEKQKEVEKKLAQHYQDLIEDTSEHKLTGSAESQV